MCVLIQVFLKCLFCSISEIIFFNENWIQFLFNTNRLRKSVQQGETGYHAGVYYTKKINPFNKGLCAYVDNVQLESEAA